MNILLPPGFNPDKNNIFNIRLPYYLLKQDQRGLAGQPKDWVIFYGVTFKNIPSVYPDEKKFAEKTNLCLNYIREHCAGCKLFYKRHPHETDESSLLDLSGFKVLEEKVVSEFFILKNFHRIKHVFSTYSSATMRALALGLDAHIFLPAVKSAISPLKNEGLGPYFKNMPPEFFIGDLNSKFQESKINIPDHPDSVLADNFSKVLSERQGLIWFIIGDPALLSDIILLSRFIKNISPGRKIGLILERHHRWDTMNMEEAKSYFDKFLEYPRWIPYLRPQTILGQIKTALSIRRAPISPDDVLVGFNYTSLTENCFISYFPKNFRIAFCRSDALEFCYGSKDSSFLKNYFIRKGFTFNIKFMLPFLGLNRVIFAEDPVRVSNFDRYSRPINDVYDQVYSFS